MILDILNIIIQWVCYIGVLFFIILFIAGGIDMLFSDVCDDDLSEAELFWKQQYRDTELYRKNKK